MALSTKVKNLFGRRRDADTPSEVVATPAPSISIPTQAVDFMPLATDLSPIKEEDEIFLPQTTPPISYPSTCVQEDGILPGDRNLFLDLSPSRALRIIAASFEPLEETSKEDRWLVESIVSASAVDRIFARRVAETASMLDDWCKEMEAWTWAGGFEAVESGDHEQDGSSRKLSAHFSGLSSCRMLTIARRIEEILEDLFDLDLFKHRNYIMSLCAGEEVSDVEDRPDSAVGLPPPSKGKLDNLSTLVTTIYIRSIATHAKILTLASAWHARIDILRLRPKLLEGMSALCNSFKSAWRMTTNDEPIDQEATAKTKHYLMTQHNALALQLDDMLDILEDQDDVLPERWIDMIDRVEEDIKHWSAVTEKRLSAQESVPRSSPRTSYIRQRGASLAIAAASALTMYRGVGGRYDDEEHDDDDDNDNTNTNTHDQPVGKDDTTHTHDHDEKTTKHEQPVDKDDTIHKHDHNHDQKNTEENNENVRESGVPTIPSTRLHVSAPATLHPRKSRQLLKSGSNNTQTRILVPGRQERNDAAVVPMRMFRIARKPVPVRERERNRVEAEKADAQSLDRASCVVVE